MASRTTKIKINTEANTSGLKDAANEVKKLQAAGDSVTKGQVALGDAGAQAQKRLVYGAGQAAMQLQDVAVQAQMGTDSMRILGQQGPQMLSAFGPTGMLAGLVVAVGAGIVGALREPKKSLEELREEADTLAESLAALVKVRFNEMEKSLEAVTNRTQQAAEAFIEMGEQQKKVNEDAASAQHSAKQAELEMRKLKGEDVAVEETLLKLAQEKAAIEEKESAAKTEAAARQHELKSELEREVETRALLTEKIREATNEIERQSGIYGELLEEQADALEGGKFLGMQHISRKKIAKAGGEVDERRTELIGAKTKRLELVNELETLNQGINLTAQQLEEVNKTIVSNLQDIDLQADADTAMASMGAISEQLKSFGLSIEAGMLAEGEGANKQVMADLQKMLADGIQPKELKGVIRALQTLGLQVNSAFGSQEVTINKLIDGLQTVKTMQAATERKVDRVISQKVTPVPR